MNAFSRVSRPVLFIILMAGICHGQQPQTLTDADFTPPPGLSDTTIEQWKPANQGNAAAQTSLGYAYVSGQGAPKDYAEALKWYRKAADQGNAIAQYNLGVMYENGWGVVKSDKIAMQWFQMAAYLGSGDATKRIDSLNTKSTDDSDCMLGFGVVGLFIGLTFLLIIFLRNKPNKYHRPANSSSSQATAQSEDPHNDQNTPALVEPATYLPTPDVSALKSENMESENKKETTMKYWYYVQDGKQVGPVSEQELVRLFGIGNEKLLECEKLNPTALVWTQELKEWMRACDVENLVPSHFNPPPIPAPPPIPSAPMAPRPPQVAPQSSVVSTTSLPPSPPQNIASVSASLKTTSAPQTLPPSTRYPGISRLTYFLGFIGALFIYGMIIGASGDKTMALLVLVVIQFILILHRLRNTGMNPWFSLISLIPIVGMIVMVRCLACQEGYQQTKKLDQTGKIIAGIVIGAFCVGLVLAVVIPLVMK